jgi:hypothetical protein
MSEVERQKQLFSDEGVKDDPAPEEEDRKRKDPDPKYCWPSDEERKLASDRFDIRNINNVRMVVQKRPV